MEEAAYSLEHCVWELTLRCNMRCLHCGSRAGRARANELTVGEALAVADQLLALGCRQVTFIGGEVFLYDGWERVARRFVDGGGQANIITNAFLMGDDQIAQVRRAGLANVGVSVDGLEDNHNRIRRVASSYQRAMAALRRLRDEGIPTAVVTSLLDFNVEDLPGLYDVLAEQAVGIWQLQIANAMGNLADGRPVLLRPEKVPGTLKFIAEHHALGPMTVYAGDDLGYYGAHEPLLRSPPGSVSTWQGCQAGLCVLGIDSVGNVKGCESLYDDRFIEGNVRQTPLAEIWGRPGAFAYNRRFDAGQLQGRCAGCDKGPICRGGCRGICFFATGNLYENPYCCYIPRLPPVLAGL